MDALDVLRHEMSECQIPTLEENKQLAREARYEELVCRNRSLVISLCRRRIKRGEDLLDAFQECCLHLWNVLPKYNPRLASFAKWASCVVLRKLTGLGISETRRLIRDTKYLESVGAISRDEDPSPGYTVACRTRIHAVIDALPTFQKMIIFARFGFGGSCITLRELGAQTGYSYERIRQIQGIAILTIRTHLEEPRSEPPCKLGG